MQSLWSDNEAAKFPGDLGLRVYTSRLLGRDKTLVLHGGGNTSVKISERNLHDEEEEILYVKGSGSDLETIDDTGFSPVRLEPVRRLASLETLSDPEMVNALKTHMTKASAPTPSVETILHAILPCKYVDHTHADALLAITNTPGSDQLVRQIYGESVILIPYVMPGFALARVCAREFARQNNRRTIGMILLKHGVFSFGNDARESYERMIQLVSRAEDYLQTRAAWQPAHKEVAPTEKVARDSIAKLRFAISRAADVPMILRTHDDARSLTFVRRNDIELISQQGPATPDHVIRTKRVPMLGTDVAAYVQAYQRYFEMHAEGGKAMLDSAPRIVLGPEFGMIAAGKTARDANVAAEIYQHTMDIIERASLVSRYEPLGARDLFEVEYWDLEQAKLKKSGTSPLFSGEIALVTGAASGIGKACVQALLSMGSAVTGFDINPEIANSSASPSYLGIVGDVTSDADISIALDTTVKTFGGLDMLVLNAGIFPATREIADLTTDEWRKVFEINLDANFVLMRQCLPLLKLAPRGGRVVIIASKNVPAPGPGVAAYSASKAALNQLARVAALEWGKDGIRVNVVHPNAVFDTGVWTEEVLRSRAQSYGLSVDAYKKNNVLATEVSSRDVARMVVTMCGPAFAKTTGAQVPVDGGNDRVI